VVRNTTNHEQDKAVATVNIKSVHAHLCDMGIKFEKGLLGESLKYFRRDRRQGDILRRIPSDFRLEPILVITCRKGGPRDLLISRSRDHRLAAVGQFIILLRNNLSLLLLFPIPCLILRLTLPSHTDIYRSLHPSSPLPIALRWLSSRPITFSHYHVPMYS
jgi:hypothetical protein